MYSYIREKNLKKQQDKLKSQGKEGNPLTRNLNDAAALAEKVARKKKEQEEQAAATAITSQTKLDNKKKSDIKNSNSPAEL